MGVLHIDQTGLDRLIASTEAVVEACRPEAQLSGVNAEGATSQSDRKAKTEKRDQAIQAAAEKIWKGDHTLTKEGVAARLNADPSNLQLLVDHRHKHGGGLSIDSVRRKIRKPGWARAKKRQKEI